MNFFENIFTTREGRIMISIIWGLGLAALFRKACKGRSCIIMKGPSPSEMEGKVYGFNDKCYTYSAENTTCAKNSH